MPSLDYFALTEPDCGAFSEFVNVARTTTYMRRGIQPGQFTPTTESGCEHLPDLLAELCAATHGDDGFYTTPADDGAPWYDAQVPESVLFAGFLPTRVDGLDSYPAERARIPLLEGGARLGPLVPTERIIEFEGELIGATCCAVAYGLRWLTAALARWCEADSCDQADLVFLEGCPTVYERCDGTSIDETARSPWRTATNVGLVEGPVVTDRRGAACGSCGCAAVTTVEFTLVAGNPWLFSPPVTVLPATALAPPEHDDCLDFTWRCEDNTPVRCDPETPEIDPGCGTIPPPPAPLVPVTCLCDPLAVWRTMVPLDLDVPRWSTAVVSVILATGAKPLRNVTVRLYRTDTVDGCDWDDVPWCDLTASLGVTFVPANSIMVVDTARRRAYYVKDGVRYSASRLVYGADGAPHQWLDLNCAGAYCAAIEADAFNTHDGAVIGLRAELREG